MNQTKTIDLTHIEPEFDKPCDEPKCDSAAQWAIFVTHTGGLGCPGYFYTCDPCLSAVNKSLAGALGQSGPGLTATCNQCGTVITGQLSDNLRVIPL